MKNVRSQVADAVDETVQYSMEKTERGLERLTNEKMTAFADYNTHKKNENSKVRIQDHNKESNRKRKRKQKWR